MMKVPLNAPTFGPQEIEAAIAVLHSGQVTMGERCFSFEKDFSKNLNTPNSIFVNSGSSANLLAFFALTNSLCPTVGGKSALKPGDEVLVPAVTWSTTVWPIVQAGLVPVLVDADPKTLQMDLTQAEAAITPKTKAICPVHVLGNAVPMDQVMALAKKYNLWVVEDTCESLGTKFQGKPVGTFGDFGTYSFFFSHHITTIEGGMLVTPHAELSELGRAMRAHGWTRHLQNRKEVEAKYPEMDPRFLFISTGFNLRPTEINAAFGILQIQKLEKFNQKRVEIAEKWTEAFAPFIKQGVFAPMQATPGTDCTWFGYPILCEGQSLRNKFQAHLENKGIETRPIICGNLARQPAFKNINHRVAGTLHGADQIMDQGLFWGSHPIMTDQEINYVIDTVKGFFK